MRASALKRPTGCAWNKVCHRYHHLEPSLPSLVNRERPSHPEHLPVDLRRRHSLRLLPPPLLLLSLCPPVKPQAAESSRDERTAIDVVTREAVAWLR